MSYALLGFALMLAGALLIHIYRVFALLMPIGILVFFLPNLIALWTRIQLGRAFRRQLTRALRSSPKQTLALRNELGGDEAQAVWLDPPHGTLGFLPGDSVGDSRPEDIAALRSVRVLYLEETQAVSFHEGRIRIPPRYAIAFTFADGHHFELITMKRRRIRQWIESLRPYVGDKLDTQALDKAI
ncbi:MAG TPA: hypothetical protein VMV40_06365 [Acidiferrobacter sp.]|nr:hypothetical protein [Acidiferrobacter sp.]